MILQAKKRNHQLSKYVNNIHHVSIEFGKQRQMRHSGKYWNELIIVSLETMCDMINKNDKEVGQPRYVAINLDKNKILVYPRPDTKYECRILGSIMVEQ